MKYLKIRNIFIVAVVSIAISSCGGSSFSIVRSDYYQKAQEAEKHGDYVAAEGMLRDNIKYHGTKQHVHNVISLVNFLIRIGKISEAFKEVKLILVDCKDSIAKHNIISHASDKCSSEIESLVDLLKKIAKIDLTRMHPRAAAEVLHTTVDAFPTEKFDWEVYNMVGVAHAEAGNMTKAEEFYRFAKTLSHENPHVLFNIAKLKIKRGHKKSGSEMLKQVIKKSIERGESALEKHAQLELNKVHR